jgi:NTE family protein
MKNKEAAEPSQDRADRRPLPRIGVALGSGSARGWSHIGVLRVLEGAGISPHIVCGTSIGALVGAAYAAGELERLEAWVRSLTRQVVVGLLDLKLGAGLIEGAKLLDFLRANFADHGIARLPKAYAAVATELATGREVWLREGSVIDAVRASIALPGVLTPAERDGRLLVDGGLVNPVPVSLCRALGADIVIAVDLNWDLVGRQYGAAVQSEAATTETSPALAAIRSKLRLGRRKRTQKTKIESPTMLDVLSASLHIMQVRITRSRLAGEPADVMVRPRLSHLALMDFHRAAASIAEGRRVAEQALPEISELLASQIPPSA